MNRFGTFFLVLLTVFSLSFSPPASYAQDPDEGIDPHDFFDSSDESADEAFFHLERFFQIGAIAGIGLHTGGLGGSHGVGGVFGFNLIYFFDNIFGFEFGTWFSFQEYRMEGSDSNIGSGALVEEGTTWLIVPNFNVRFYYPTNNLTRMLASLNPYFVLGFDWVLRKNKIEASTVAGTNTGRQGTSKEDNNFGLNFGAGISSLVYGDSTYLGLDIRYHLIMFQGEKDSTTGFSRGGDYITILASFIHDF